MIAGDDRGHPPGAERGAWTRASFRDPSTFSYRLKHETVAEMDAAIESVRARDIGVQQVTGEDFRLRSFAADAGMLREEILDGRGFVVIDGSDTGRVAAEDLALIYWAVGNALGEVLPQNLAGDRMCTVADLGYAPGDANVRNSMTSREIGMHTDTVVFADIDIVGLLCVVQSGTGGESRLISASSIYDRMAREAPMALEQLGHDFPIDRRTEYTADMGPTAEAPILVKNDRGVRMQYNYKLMVSGAAKTGRVISDAEQQALDTLNGLLDDEHLMVEFRLEPAQMVFLSNHRVLHDRGRWVDDPDPGRKRHLERMWIRVC